MIKFDIEATIDFFGYADYWSGHGHAVANKDLLACMRFDAMIDYSETVKELVDMIMDSINAYMSAIDYVGWPNHATQQEKEEIEEISDQDIRKAVRREFNTEDDNEKVFYEDTQREFQEYKEQEESEGYEIMEYPMCIGWIHIYRSEEQ